MSLTAALARVDSDELVTLTRALVRIPSVVRPTEAGADESAVVAHVADWMRREGFDVELQHVTPARANVLGAIGDAAQGKTLLLEGHTDVVTEGDPAQWTHDPFGAELVDGRIYGRGAADMKGGLAAAMIAAAALWRSGTRLAGRVLVGALVDEEGDMLGVKHLCATPTGRAIDAAIVCEPEQNELCLEQRGVVWARVTVGGHMAHGAMPEAGVNPIAALASLLDEAQALERRLRRLCQRSRYLRPPTVTPTTVRAPSIGVAQANVIPASAQATLDVRLTPGPDAAAVAKEIDEACRRVAARHPGTVVTWEPISGFRLATRVDRSEPLVRAMRAAVRLVTGKPARFGGVPGSTDGTILRMERGIPIVTCGPGPRLIPHQVDEYVEVPELVDAARIYVAAALAYLIP